MMSYLMILFATFIIISSAFPNTKFDNDQSKVFRQNPEEMGGHFEGDMIFPEDYIRGAPSRPSTQRWPNGTVPYLMTSSISDVHQTLIVDAMRKLEELTMVNNKLCVQFRPKLSTDVYFLTVQNSTGCSSNVGYRNGYSGNYSLNLMHTPNITCMKTGTIQHELIHVLGLFHEQSRPDRDEFVNIDFSNTIPIHQHNFQKYTNEQIDTLGTAYDYGSIMHYSQYAFSMNGRPTIIPTKNASAVIGQREGLSPTDILEIQRYYSCVSTSPSTPTSTPPSTPPTSSDGKKLISLISLYSLFSLLVTIKNTC